MSGKLRFHLEYLSHPYAGDPSAQLEAWGHLTVNFVTPDAHVTLFEVEWNLDVLVEWLTESQAALCCDTLPLHEEVQAPERGESLAIMFHRYLEVEVSAFQNEDKYFYWLRTLSEYGSKHCLWNALSGVSMPLLVVGCNHGVGEISQLSEPLRYKGALNNLTNNHLRGNWAYSFDMNDFIQHLREESRRFLHVWLESSENPDVYTRANTLILQLQASSTPVNGCCN